MNTSIAYNLRSANYSCCTVKEYVVKEYVVGTAFAACYVFENIPMAIGEIMYILVH